MGDIRRSGVQGESGGMEAFCSANVMNAVVFDDQCLKVLHESNALNH